jgi:hypothetical protein
MLPAVMNRLVVAALVVALPSLAAEPKPKAPKRVECARVDLAAPDYALEFEVNPKLPKYQLKVGLSPAEGDRTGVAQLAVGPVDAKAPQDITADEHLDASLTGDVYPVLRCDVNFDGYQDLLVFAMTGTPANEWFRFLIFDPATRRFVLAPEEMVGNPQLDPARKEVVGTVGSGCCSTSTTRLKVEKKRVRKLSERLDPMRP